MSMTIPFAAGAASKLFLKQWCNEVRIEGLPTFLDKLKGDRGVLTIANHISVVDEPFMWGCLPISMFLDSRTTRWTLGASDMMFTGKLDSWFFRNGQVIETLRGKGIYQKAIDEAAKKLEEGRWVHIFPEGMIKQDSLNELRRFKWGISRILFETDPKRMPHIVPIWINGFEQVMHESREWPRMIPRPAKNVSILFGDSINSSVEPLIEKCRARFPTPWRPDTYGRDVKEDLKNEPDDLTKMRSELAAKLREGLMKIGNDGRVEKLLQQEPTRIRWNRIE